MQHKSEIPHPTQKMMATPGQDVEGAIELHMSAGDALLFNDSLLHGAAARLNPGQRRVLCIRYLPSIYRYRWPYTCSDAVWAQCSIKCKSLLSSVARQEGGAMGNLRSGVGGGDGGSNYGVRRGSDAELAKL